MKVESPEGLTLVCTVGVKKEPAPCSERKVSGPVSEGQGIVCQVHYFPAIPLSRKQHFGVGLSRQ